MKTVWTVLSFAALALVIAFTGACATLPPQVRPTSPGPFVGNWNGTWVSSLGPTGSVKATIEPRGNVLQILVKYTNAVVPGFAAEVRFVNGELIVDQPISMVLRLHGNDYLEANYYNKRNNSQGTWSLKKDTGARLGPGVQTVQTVSSIASATSSDRELIQKLIDGSPWKGEFGYGSAGGPGAGTVTVIFTFGDGSLKGELISITGRTTACPGPLAWLEVKGDKVTFTTPCNNVSNELRLDYGELVGSWVGGRFSGWLSMSSEK